METVAFTYFGWHVVVDDTLPDDAYIVEPASRHIRMCQSTWFVLSRDGLIEDIVDTLTPDVAGLMYPSGDRYFQAKTDELDERPDTLSQDRLQTLLEDTERLIQEAAAAGSEDVVLMGRFRDVRSKLDALRDDLALAAAHLDLAERAVAKHSVTVV